MFHAVTIPAAPDTALLAAIHAECFDAPWSEQAIADMLGVPGTHVVVVENKGFGMVRCVHEDAEILTLAVRPAFRRSGIARAIVSHISEVARQQGAKTIFLEVRKSNSAAQKLYQNTGFAEMSRRRLYYRNPDGSGEDACVLRKML